MYQKTLIMILSAILAVCPLSGCGREEAPDEQPPASGSSFEEAVGDGISDITEGTSEIMDDIGDGISDIGKDTSDWMDDDRHSSDSRPEFLPSERESTAIEASAVLPGIDLSSLSGEKQGWGQGVQVDEQNRPLGSLVYQEKYEKYDAYFIGENEKVIYLTFDEGYENGYTPAILDTLKEKKVPAVFFATLSYIKSQPELIQRMIDEGHVVGNHSDKHPSFPEISSERCEQEIRNVDQYMKENFNYTDMHLFRPPAGEFSDRVLAQMQNLGYKTIFWSFAYRDWDPENQIGEEKALQKINGALHNGAIYLLHAVSSDNAAVLGRFIDEARLQGYQFKLFS